MSTALEPVPLLFVQVNLLPRGVPGERCPPWHTRARELAMPALVPWPDGENTRQRCVACAQAVQKRVPRTHCRPEGI